MENAVEREVNNSLWATKAVGWNDPDVQICIQWNDSDLKVDWPLEEIHSPILSKKDIAAKPLWQLMDVSPWFE